MKALLLVVLAAAAVSAISVGLCHWYEHRHTVKRVAVSYIEKYEDKTLGRREDYVKVDEESALFAEEKLSIWIDRDKTCMVLSHDAKRADYHVNIAVNRFVGDPRMHGEATLTITRANGDVVVIEHFYQDKDSYEDIALQPVTEAWEVLCKVPQQN